MADQNRLVALVVEVADLDRSLLLYREGFGIDLHEAAHDDDDRWIGGRHAAYSWTDGAFMHFALYAAKGEGSTSGAQVGLMVSDLDDAHQRAIAAGAEVIHEPRVEPWGQTARYRDFDNNVISLTQRA